MLMANPVHLLVTPCKPLAIAKLMQSVGRHYVRYVNDPYRRSGTLGGALQGQLVDCERYVLSCYRSIELNPVRAGRVSDPADYRWSSYRRNAEGGADAVVAGMPSTLPWEARSLRAVRLTGSCFGWTWIPRC